METQILAFFLIVGFITFYTLVVLVVYCGLDVIWFCLIKRLPTVPTIQQQILGQSGEGLGYLPGKLEQEIRSINVQMRRLHEDIERVPGDTVDLFNKVGGLK